MNEKINEKIVVPNYNNVVNALANKSMELLKWNNGLIEARKGNKTYYLILINNYLQIIKTL